MANVDVVVKLPLSRIFNNAPSKILDFLLTNQTFDYSESDISRLAGVPSRTLQRVLPSLIKEGLVQKTRKSGKIFMYEINKDSRKAEALLGYIEASRDAVFENAERFQRPAIKQKS